MTWAAAGRHSTQANTLQQMHTQIGRAALIAARLAFTRIYIRAPNKLNPVVAYQMIIAYVDHAVHL